jgi:hypothetical protein
MNFAAREVGELLSYSNVPVPCRDAAVFSASCLQLSNDDAEAKIKPQPI